MNPGDVIDGRFVIEALRGEGGMGRVYRALDRTTNTPAALKTMSAGSVHRFSREAETLAQIRHPNVVSYLGSGSTDDGTQWLAMEWLDGEDLSERLEREPLDLEGSLAVGRSIASALAAAHERGIVHRDIKPANVFLPNGDPTRAKVLDFGIARVLDLARATATGTIVGTLGYMAPEQARGRMNVGPWADLFSLGCVLFECLSRRPAFSGGNAVAVLAKLLLETPPTLASLDLDPPVPEALSNLVARLVEKEPDDRPASALEVLAALDSREAIRGAIGYGKTIHAPAAPALGRKEQSLVSVVLAAREVTAFDDTEAADGDSTMKRRISDAAAQNGASVAELMGGTLVATVSVVGTPRDQARQAARCALAMHHAGAGMRVVLTTGRQVDGGAGSVGAVIDRGAALLSGASSSAIRIDEVTASLLSGAFDVRLDEDRGWLVTRELAAAETRAVRRACFGRERELSTLLGLFEECTSEPAARAALIVGPPGIGKSCLLEEALARAERSVFEDAERWRAEADPVGGGSPFGMIARVLRSAAGLRGVESPDEKRARLRELAARHVAADAVDRVASGLALLCGVARAEDANTESMHGAWDDLVVSACRKRPLVLVLEDLQWADAASLRAIDGSLRRSKNDAALFVLATARPELATQSPNLWADRGVQEIRVHELGQKAAQQLVKHHLGADADASLVKDILAHAAGNAFFLEELAQATAEGRLGPIPDTVASVIEARLRNFDPEDRRVLRAASIFGQSFFASGLEVLLGDGGMTTEQLRARLDALVERDVLRREADDRAETAPYAFSHALLREAAYAMLLDEDRRLGHAMVGDWLEARGAADFAVIAHHFEQGGELARALFCYEQAARDSLLVGESAPARELAEHALGLGAEGEARGRLLALAAEAYTFLGLVSEAHTCGTEALGLLPPGSPDWIRASKCTLLGKFSHSARSLVK